MILLFLVFLVVLSLLLEYWSIEKAPESISADVRTDRRILEQGEEFSLVYTVTNTGRLPRSYVHISQYIPGSINAEGSRSMRFTDERAFDFRIWIGAGTRREVRIRAVAAKRGRYFVPDFAIVTGDFLGFREMRKAGEGKHYNELVIWPRAITSPDLSQAVGGFLSLRRPGADGGLPGVHRQRAYEADLLDPERQGTGPDGEKARLHGDAPGDGSCGHGGPGRPL